MARSPDPTELLAQKHLESRFSDVAFEPDGNVSPDFLINRKIAVEVRRLNQNEDSVGKPKGLEEESIPLEGRINKLLKSFGPPRSGQSWFVCYKFYRPLEDRKMLEESLKQQLERFIESPVQALCKFNITDTFEITIIPSNKPLEGVFCLGGPNDGDSGGWLLSEFDRNIKLCIEHKNSKISRVRYGEWWLLLVDQIGYTLSPSDRKEFLSFFNFNHPWDRIVIVDPTNPLNYFEI